MPGEDKPIVWLHGEVRTPPLTSNARIEAGLALRRLQRGESLGMPLSRPLPSLCGRCHELRVIDQAVTWRIVYRIDPDAVVVVEVFCKKTRGTPKHVLDACRRRLRTYDALAEERR